ncbi:MAG: outer rane porin protein, partial [Rhodoferax sp.]|nr:outer rane porin protein [Rhodoferax sp.]
MHKLSIAAALLISAVAGPCQGQSAVRIYGILDVAVAGTKISHGTSLVRMQQTGHYPTRLGFEGQEDLGGGLKATFRLEQGFAVDTGTLLQGG